MENQLFKKKENKSHQESIPTGVISSFHDNDPSSIVILQADNKIQNLKAWIEQNLKFLDRLILKHGAVLIRGGCFADVQEFVDITNVFIPKIARYVEGGTPRTHLKNGTYTSTEFPKELSIFQHNELSYMKEVPEKIIFGCLEPASELGATPICDVRKVLNAIDKDIIEEFRKRKWKLLRNFGTGLGPDLMQAFGTESIPEIEKYCRKMDIECEVIDEFQVKTVRVRPAISSHKLTNEEVWLNHIAFWHPSSLTQTVREEMLYMLGEEGMPYNVFWGDGEKISDDIITNIRDAYQQSTIRFDWHKGDVLLMDNLLMSHGREPYEGERTVLVSMGMR